VIEHVADWRALWPWVSDGLWQIIERTNPTWIPEDVYCDLKAGQASLLTIDGDKGFAVVKRLIDYDGPSMFLWAMWGPGALAPMYEEVMSELDNLARAAGCKRIRMMSPRKGWQKVRGWKERDTVYERSL
jgi:hypothetical protein